VGDEFPEFFSSFSFFVLEMIGYVNLDFDPLFFFIIITK